MSPIIPYRRTAVYTLTGPGGQVRQLRWKGRFTSGENPYAPDGGRVYVVFEDVTDPPPSGPSYPIPAVSISPDEGPEHNAKH